MTKHARKSDHLQIVESPKVLVEVPLPLLGALANTRNAFFGLCVDAGRQVLDAMMEQDRASGCVVRSGSGTPSASPAEPARPKAR